MTDAGYDAVCVGAHPDDVEIGMGATIAKMTAAGRRVAIVDLTNGEPTPHGSVEVRAAESARAAEILGVQVRRTLTQPNRYLFDTVEARTELAEVLRELRPRMLFIPYAEDAHPDHIAASSIAVAARFYSKFTKTSMAGEPFYPARVFRYMAVHLRVVAQPTFVVECADYLPRKLDALARLSLAVRDEPRECGHHRQHGAGRAHVGSDGERLGCRAVLRARDAGAVDPRRDPLGDL